MRKSNLTESQLADRIRVHVPQDNTPLRLNSCSDLESAKLFSKEFPNRDVYATNAIVNIHADGGITVTARPPSNNQEWRKLKNGEDVGKANNPEPPVGEANSKKFVTLGVPAFRKLLADILAFNPSLPQDINVILQQLSAIGFHEVNTWEIITKNKEYLFSTTKPPRTIDGILEEMIKNNSFAKEIVINPDIATFWHRFRVIGLDSKKLATAIKDGEVVASFLNVTSDMNPVIVGGNALEILLKKYGLNSRYSVYKDGNNIAFLKLTNVYPKQILPLPNGQGISKEFNENFLEATAIKSTTSTEEITAFSSCTVAAADVALRLRGKK